MSHLFLIILFFLVFIVSPNNSYSQSSWEALMLKDDSNKTLEEVKDAFEREWENKPYKKGFGFKQFHRWAHFWETRLNPDGTFASYENIYKEFNEFMRAYENSGLEKSRSVNGDWVPIGPFDYTYTSSWSPGQGRINVVVSDPNNPQVIYAGAPAGGLWKSIDDGSTWTPLTDDFSAIGISGIAVDPNDSDVIYISTGDADGGDTYSIGVWKTLDGGLTWNPTGNISGQTHRVLIDPLDNNTIYVGSSSGMWKSTNGGNTWSNILPQNIKDIAIKPNQSNTIYAASPNVFYYSNDGGNSFNTASGLPPTGERIVIGVTPADDEYVYILSADDNYEMQGLYRSTNSGVSFNLRYSNDDIFDQSGQAWFDLAMCVSPTDPEMIFTGVLNVWKSTNGGNSFSQVNSWSDPGSPAYTHADIHYLHYHNGSLYCGSDGGVYRSDNDGVSFEEYNSGLQIGQFYTIAVSQNDPTTIAGGLQDNGGFAYTNNVWKVYYGADGMESAIDPNNSNNIYGMIQFGDLYQTTDGGTNLSGLGSPENGVWVTPMQIDPNNDRILAGYSELYEYTQANGWISLSNFGFSNNLRHLEIFEGNSDVILVATNNQVFRTSNNGSTFTEITNNIEAVTFSSFVITSIEINPNNENEIWITIGGASASNKVVYSNNGGQSWINISGNLPNIPTHIVKHENGSDGGIYVGTDVGVYYSNNSMNNNWIPFMDNLPNVIVNDLEIIESAGIIRAGTYGRGVWQTGTFEASTISNDAGLTNLENVSGTLCEPDVAAVFKLINSGVDTLFSVNINYVFNGGNVNTFQWQGTLPSYQSEQVTLPSQNLGVGSHNFMVYTSEPNGNNDGNLNNDTLISQFTISDAILIDLEIMLDCWGSETTWDVKDQVGALVAFGGPYADNSPEVIVEEKLCLPDNQCYEFNIYDTYGDGMNGSAYAPSCTTDGNYFIYDIDGNILASLIASNSDFGFQETNELCVNFDNTSGISEYNTIFLSVFPNPTKDLVNITFKLNKSEEVNIQLFDMNGKIIHQKEHLGNIGNNQVSFDLKSVSAGFYYLSVNQSKVKLVKK